MKAKRPLTYRVIRAFTDDELQRALMNIERRGFTPSHVIGRNGEC